MRIRTLFFILLLQPTQYCLGQNLILNPDVEQENICTEYSMPCEPKGWWNASIMTARYNKDPAMAYSGNHSLILTIAGSAFYIANRTYWQTMLPCKLHKGKRYRISLHIGSLYSGVDPTLLSLLFSDTLIMRKSPGIIDRTPNITFSQEDVHKVRHSRWLEIIKDFTPDRDYRVIIFGNFSKNPSAAVIKKSKGQIAYVLDKLNLVCLDDTDHFCSSYYRDSLAIMNSRERHTIPLPSIIPTQRLSPKDSPVYQEANPVPLRYSIDTIRFPNVLFKVNSSVLNFSYLDTLESLGARIIKSKLKSMQIVGYTDNSGSDSLNKRLSYLRAQSVYDFLIKTFHFDTDKITIIGRGSQNPLYNNNTPEGRSKNRRVEIYLYYSIQQKER